MTKEQREAADAQLQSATTIGAILDTPHGAAVLASPKALASFEKQAKHLGENLSETSKSYAAHAKK